MDYYVNESKRTIVAVIPDAKFEITNTIESKVKKVLQGQGMPELDAHFVATSLLSADKIQRLMQDTYKGKAKCSPNDEWDVEHGIEIARHRALCKYWWAVRKLYLEIMSLYLEPLAYAVEEEAEDINDRVSLRVQHLWNMELE